MNQAITLRMFSTESDDVGILTALIHRSYKRLADMGLNFVATYQDEAVTLARISEGEGYVALAGEALVGTIVFRNSRQTSGSPWLNREGVASFCQYAVAPEFQGHGIGSALLALVEQRARETGANEIALDTAEPAEHLIRFYSKKGYRFVEYVQWDVTNYRSVVMSKGIS